MHALVADQVIAEINLGNIRKASTAWEKEFDIREVRDEPRAVDAHQIAGAFLERATVLKSQNDVNWRFAAWEATRWAASISTLLRQEQEAKGGDPQDHALWRADADRINTKPRVTHARKRLIADHPAASGPGPVLTEQPLARGTAPLRVRDAARGPVVVDRAAHLRT
ncbi:hypothetical protein [Enhygromyxa salina]|uniref:hypothetical protein n=1 Tax=Enhygromyxa salina TaxID=215803 RepID=UPI0011B1D89B|nr:hypothetical protein [Enhygromyxa salina]